MARVKYGDRRGVSVSPSTQRRTVKPITTYFDDWLANLGKVAFRPLQPRQTTTPRVEYRAPEFRQFEAREYEPRIQPITGTRTPMTPNPSYAIPSKSFLDWDPRFQASGRPPYTAGVRSGSYERRPLPSTYGRDPRWSGYHPGSRYRITRPQNVRDYWDQRTGERRFPDSDFFNADPRRGNLQPWRPHRGPEEFPGPVGYAPLPQWDEPYGDGGWGGYGGYPYYGGGGGYTSEPYKGFRGQYQSYASGKRPGYSDTQSVPHWWMDLVKWNI